MSYGWSAGSFDTQMTSVVDGRTHTVAAADFDAGIWQGKGRYRAVCGADVVVAALVSGPGPLCPRCPTPHLHESEPSPRTARLRAALAMLPGFGGLRVTVSP